MARLYQNFQSGTLTAGLSDVATSMSSAELAALVAVSGSNTVTLVLDPDASAGAPEIVWVTAHTASATSATISRGQEGSTARAHLSGVAWRMVVTDTDFERLDTIEANDWVTAARIAAGAVGTTELAAGAVTASKITAGTITSTELGADSVGATQIAALAVGTAELANGSVTAAKIAAATITATELASDSVTSAKIAADAVGSSEIASGAVGADEIAAGAVGTSELADGGVTVAKHEQWPRVRVYRTTANNVSTGTVTTMYFASSGLGGAEDYDTDSIHSLSTNTSRFTVPTGYDGMWEIQCQFTWQANATGTRAIWFEKNQNAVSGGTRYGKVEGPGQSGSVVTQSVSVTIPLSAGDYVELFCYQNSGSTLTGIGTEAHDHVQFRFAGPS